MHYIRMFTAEILYSPKLKTTQCNVPTCNSTTDKLRYIDRMEYYIAK